MSIETLEEFVTSTPQEPHKFATIPSQEANSCSRWIATNDLRYRGASLRSESFRCGTKTSRHRTRIASRSYLCTTESCKTRIFWQNEAKMINLFNGAEPRRFEKRGVTLNSIMLGHPRPGNLEHRSDRDEPRHNSCSRARKSAHAGSFASGGTAVRNEVPAAPRRFPGSASANGRKIGGMAGRRKSRSVHCSLFPQAQVICSATPEITGTRALSSGCEPADLADV